MIRESRLEVVGSFPIYPQAELRREASQPRVSAAEGREGGPIHRAFVEALPPGWQADPEVEIFSRLLWLKEGWYPLSPHYHFDWAQSPGGPQVETLMVLLGDNSLTEFVLGPLEHSATGHSATGRQRWDSVVAAGLRSGALRTWALEPGKLIRFDNRTLHRARPATRTGWRLLIRAIRGLERARSRGQAGFGKRAPFATCRNSYVPETDHARARYEPYRQ